MLRGRLRLKVNINGHTAVLRIFSKSFDESNKVWYVGLKISLTFTELSSQYSRTCLKRLLKVALFSLFSR